MSPLTYRPDLDGLRCVAVYLVLLFHAGVVSMGGGFIGVDLFFVLSGFLVTHVILREVDRTGSFGLRDFYARRVRRLLPAALLVVVVTLVLQLLVSSLPRRLELVDDARGALLYYANWHFVAESRDYFADSSAASPFLHFWSLAIEEQFYIVFPLLVLLVLRWSWRPERLLGVVLVALLVASVVLQVLTARVDADLAYYGTHTRIYQLAAGSLLALSTRAGLASAAARWGGWPRVVAPAGLVGLVLLSTGLLDVTPSTRGLLATLAGVATVAGLTLAPAGRLARTLGSPAPRFLGQISYGTYLWHWPVLLALGAVLEVRPLAMAVLGGAVSTGLAALSHQLLETPVRRTVLLEGRGTAVVATGLTLSAIVAALVVPSVLDSARRPAVATLASTTVRDGAGRLARPVPAGLDLVEAQRDVPALPPLCTPAEPDACVLTEGGSGHVLVVGDSQARMFVDAFERVAEERDLTLSHSIVSGCPWQEGLSNAASPRERDALCEQSRGPFLREVLPTLGVDVVVAISLSRAGERWEEDLVDRDTGREEPLEQRVSDATDRTVRTLRATGAEVVLVKSLLGTETFDLEGFDPLECLARADRLVDCAVYPPLERPWVDGMLESVARQDRQVHAVDLNPVLCVGRPACAPVVRDTVVWRDPDHVTATWLVQRRRELWSRLEATGAV